MYMHIFDYSLIDIKFQFRIHIQDDIIKGRVVDICFLLCDLQGVRFTSRNSG